MTAATLEPQAVLAVSAHDVWMRTWETLHAAAKRAGNAREVAEGCAAEACRDYLEDLDARRDTAFGLAWLRKAVARVDAARAEQADALQALVAHKPVSS